MTMEAKGEGDGEQHFLIGDEVKHYLQAKGMFGCKETFWLTLCVL